MNKNKAISRAVSGVLLCTMATYTLPILAYTKDETVYSKINGNGENYDTMVSDHLKNDDKDSILNDATDLLDIKNTNGDETYNQNGNSLTWNANGNDIYYQGKSQKELPIECKVTYTLDGQEISAQDIAGKSGKVSIKIEYTNKDAHSVDINGKTETLYTPFVVIVGTVINNDNNKNIAITNGKTMDEGSKTIVAGMAMPGLQESLGISKDKIDIPNSVEISMNATNFEINSIMSYVTPKVIDKNDINGIDNIDDIFAQADKLQSSSKELVDGANTLSSGANTLSEKSQEFNGAMNKFSDGMSNANSSYNQIDSGINTLNSSSSTLEAGAKQISDGTQTVQTYLNQINAGLTSAKTGTDNLSQGESALGTGVDTIISGVNQLPSTDNTSSINSLEYLVSKEQSQITNLTNLNTALNQLKASDSTGYIAQQITANNGTIQILTGQIDANKQTINTLKSTDASKVKALKDGLTQVKTGITNLQGGTKQLSSGIDTLSTGASKLSNANNAIVSGSNELYKGTSKLKNGTDSLASGSSQMKSGLSTLDSSANQLTSANTQLTQGTETLSSGANKLANGINQFNEQGIEKICNYINGDVKDVKTRIDKLSDLANQYNKFTMSNDGTESSVKFIMIIDQIKKDKEEDNSKQEALPSNDNSVSTYSNSEETSNK